MIFRRHVITEAGHISFAPQTDLQEKVLHALHARYERVSNERVLSGHGLENIFGTLRIINGLDVSGWSAAETARKSITTGWRYKQPP